MKNILVGIDFNEHSEILINQAIRFAKAFGSKIWLLHAASPDPDYVGYEAGPQFMRDDRANELKKEHKQLLEYANKIKDSGIDSEGLLIQGPTIQTIMAESRKLNIELIICGHHKHNYLYNALFGSHAQSIVMKSSIPVLVVPLAE